MDITDVEVLHHYVVRLRFKDGVERSVDLAPYLQGPVFREIRSDPRVFGAVRVDSDSGTIVWPNGADLAPDVLYEGRRSARMEAEHEDAPNGNNADGHMAFKPLDQVMTLDGRAGVIKSIAGDHATVLIGTGQQDVALSDLTAVAAGPAESAAAGHFGDAERAALRLQARYLLHAYRYDLRSGLSNARIEPKLHQVFIAHRVATKLQPRMILADEVGLGKTIEAGLILKELRARGVLERVLIVCPASLQYQWKQELASKFNEDFEIMTASAAKYFGQGKTNPFGRRPNIIASLNFVQNDRRMDQIQEVPWDLVIFDEAHRVRRWMASPNKPKTTKAYKLADELKELVDGLLLLTATPMQLHHYELYSLVELVEPGLFGSFEEYDRRRKLLPALNDLMRRLREWNTLTSDERSEVVAGHSRLLQEATEGVVTVAELESGPRREAVMDDLVERHPLAQVMIRNRKAEIGGFAGREANRITVELTDEELQLYEDLSDYLRNGYDRAVASKQHAVGFLMVTYQKMLASSSYCVMQSFRRRVQKLRKQLGGVTTKPSPNPGDPIEDVLEELETAEPLEELASRSFESLEHALVETEIAELEELIGRLENLPGDSKADELLEALETIWDQNPDEKVVIFTTFRDTQEYLRRLVEQHLVSGGRPVRVSVFNGSLGIDQKEEAIKRFRNDHQLLISTESGGEGRNLQFAHILINYDLPWNPMKVEQRIGRLDRIGQKKKVFIYNLACAETIEERILSVLEHRIQLFTESVGSLDPILGELEGRLSDLIMRHRSDFDIEFDSLDADIERQTRQARENERVLADFVLDRASFRRDQANALLGAEPLATAADLESFVAAALDYFGGTVMEHAEGGQVITLAPSLASRLHASKPQVRGVFSPERALAMEDLDFFAIGHPTVDRVLELAEASDDSTAVVAVAGLEAPTLELVYQLRAETIPPQGHVIRHLVGPTLEVRSEELTGTPARHRPGHAEPPSWIADAVAASREKYQNELADLRSRVQSEAADRQDERLARAQRIFDYRRDRLARLIDEQERWLQAADRSSERIRKVLPAREGKLKTDRDRLDRLESEFEADLAQIRNERPAVAGELWFVALLVPEQ